MSNESAYNDKTILRVGSTLLMGKYRIEKCLSSGGFSNTYLGVNVFNELEQFTEKGSATFTYFDSIRTFDIVLFTNGDIKVDGILYKYDEILLDVLVTIHKKMRT